MSAFELPRHTRSALRALVYMLEGVIRGLVNLPVVALGLAVGFVLSPAWDGSMRAASRLAWRCGGGERARANRFLHAHLPPLPRGTQVSRGTFWSVMTLLLIQLPLTLVALLAAAVPAGLTVALALLGAGGVAGSDARFVGPWALGVWSGLLLLALALPAAIVTLAALEGLGLGLRAVARRLLATREPVDGPVRELLAERLGDHSLTIAYWLPERGRFVDDHGRPVELPEPESGRTWTAVDHEGARVAAIVHDAELDASPELVTAAASAAVLAIDNERLKAELRARVEDLRVSRVRIVEAADEARRNIERDLHDGAQQQLVSLALDLRILYAQLGDSDQRATVGRLADKLAEALGELRELARGIHPAVLSERGLGAAVEALVDRSPLDVRASVELDGARLPAAVEAAAYFVIAEGLTNVVRYAETRHADIVVCRNAGELEVVVADDGRGGATLDAGTGLRGLIDRLVVLDGRLELDSPLGAGTRLRARIPVDQGSLVAEAAGR